MKVDKILLLVFFALLVIAFICMGSGALGTGFIILIIAIIEGFIAWRVWISMVLRHDVMQLSTKYSREEILRAAESAFISAKWKSAVGPGQINYMWSTLGGLVSGAVLSVTLQNKYDNTCEIDVWMSSYNRDKYGQPKNAGQIIKMKNRVLMAVAQYAE